MAKTLSLDSGFQVLDDLPSVRLRVRQKLLFVFGEYFVDTELGIPYLQDILGRNLAPELVGTHIGYYVSQVQDVTDVHEVNVEPNQRTGGLEIDMLLGTTFGETRLGVSIGGTGNG